MHDNRMIIFCHKIVIIMFRCADWQRCVVLAVKPLTICQAADSFNY